jgi:hypothetical protein
MLAGSWPLPSDQCKGMGCACKILLPRPTIQLTHRCSRDPYERCGLVANVYELAAFGPTAAVHRLSIFSITLPPVDARAFCLTLGLPGYRRCQYAPATASDDAAYPARRCNDDGA